MALIDKVDIVFQNNGKRKKVMLSWLLSQAAQWAFDARPFIVQDDNLAEIIKDATFNGKPVKHQLIAKYHYLKTVLDEAEQDLHVDNPTEDETEEHQVVDIPETVLEEVLEINEPTEETITLPENDYELWDVVTLKGLLDQKGIKYDKRLKNKEKLIAIIKTNNL